MTQYVLYGAGTTGRVVARQLTAAGNPPVAFADNNVEKWGVMEGVLVGSPEDAKAVSPMLSGSQPSCSRSFATNCSERFKS